MTPKRYVQLRLETLATQEQFTGIQKELWKVKEARVEAAKWRRPKTAFLGGPPPVETFFAIITALAGIAKIAEILHRHLRKQPVKVKFDGKEMTLNGQWTKDEICEFLERFAKALRKGEFDNKAKILDRKRKREMRKELKRLKDILPTYQRLVDVLEEAEKKKSFGWRKRRLRDYRRTKKRIESDVASMEGLLRRS